MNKVPRSIPASLCNSLLFCPSLGALFLLLDLCVWAAGPDSAAAAGYCTDKKAR